MHLHARSSQPTPSRRRGLAFAASFLLSAVAVQAADTLYLLTTDGKLATTKATSAASYTTPVALTGVAAGETLVAIDVRPQNQRLYALGVNAAANTGTLYCISVETNLATPVGPFGGIAFTTDGATQVFFPDPATADWDIDFNPAVDRLRVVAGSLNFRVNPNTGAPVDGDNTGLTFDQVLGTNPDGAINGATTTLGGVGYTNNSPDTDGDSGNNVTTLYALDATSDGVYLQNPPNAGTASAQGSFRAVGGGAAINVDRVRGFDIAPDWKVAGSNQPLDIGVGYMIAEVGGDTLCFGVNLSNNGNAGKLQQLSGPLGLGVRSLAVRTVASSAIALNKDGTQIKRFDIAAASTLSSVNVSGLTDGEQLMAIDARPATGQLYGLGVNATANTGTLYLLDPQTGVLTVVGVAGQVAVVNAVGAAVDLPDATSGYGMDFNPVADRVRIVTGSGLNFRINPNTGLPVDGDNGGAPGTVTGLNPDGNLSGSTAVATATAYTNNFGGATATTQYSFDSRTGNLYIQNTPNSGALSFVGSVFGAPFDASEVSGFDIPSSVAVSTSGTKASGFGWMLVGRPGGGFTQLYRVDLATGSGQPVGAYGSEQGSGLVVWATAPDIAVEGPGGALVDNTTVDFGTTAGAPVLSRTFTIRNNGSQPMTYTTQAPSNGAFVITQGDAGSIPGGGSTTLTVKYTPGTTSEEDFMAINSDDPDASSFIVRFSGPGYLPLAEDRTTPTAGETRLQPLANDALAGTLTILSVSDNTITISGRTLIIPAGYTGSFTYDVSNGTLTGRATVTVTAGTAAVSPLAFSGILTDGTGKVAGVANVAVTTKGVATAKLLLGTFAATKKLTFATGVDTVSGTVSFGKPAALATLDLDRSLAGTVKVTFTDASTAVFRGTLHAATSALPAVQKHHIALASIDSTIPGGAYAIATISKKGAVKLVGLLPDGHAISAGATLLDNGTFAFYAIDKKSKPAATYGGELTLADLSKTDVTGELVWVKPGQVTGAKGLYLLGEDTVLTANGSLFTGLAPLLNGAGTLKLTGGNLAADESIATTVATTGIPTSLAGSSVKTWTGVKQKVGTFSATVAVPSVTKPVKAKGLYLPKANRAWGFFPGLTLGGSIELTVP